MHLDQDTWFPYPPHQKDTNPVVEYGNLESLHDAKHGIQMGIASKYCDDGKVGNTWYKMKYITRV